MKQGYQTADCSNYEILKANAYYNRSHPTDAESLMWEILSGKTIGPRFRRQHIIDNYIVDFVCLSKKLIIEIDGEYHLRRDQAELDQIRENKLIALGYRLLRFTNEEVMTDIEKVIEKINRIVNE